MGFKADTSFLRFLTIGATAARHTVEELRSMGFQPVELERYCTSNKIWVTKVKRLRLPDVLCVRTGLRFEIRGKSKLAIKMSDAPTNPDRTWHAGLRDNDIAAFVTVFEEHGKPYSADHAVFIAVEDLKNSVDTSKLGPPKSASEGAERDRTWPACIPSQNGRVTEVTKEKIIVEFDGGRKQTYTLKDKSPYVTVGSTFQGGASIIAGTPAKVLNLGDLLNHPYDPIDELTSINSVDRYAAVKALRYRTDLHADTVAPLEKLLANETEDRVALEASGTLAALGSENGRAGLCEFLDGRGHDYLRMETVFILTELGDEFAKTKLVEIANDQTLEASELRQAAIWGLGKAGLRAFDEVAKLINDPDTHVAMHSIAAFDSSASPEILNILIQHLRSDDRELAAAASEALRLIATEGVARALVESHKAQPNDWITATIGRLPATVVTPLVEGTDLKRSIAPMMLLSEGANRLASEDAVLDIAFLSKQNVSSMR